MKLSTRVALLAAITLYAAGPATLTADTLTPCPLESAEIGGFWRQHYKRLTTEWLPHCVRQMEFGGRGQELLNLVNTAKAMRDEPHGEYTGLPWSDAYVYNTVEAICMALSLEPGDDPELLHAQEHLQAKLEEWIPIILSAQLDDGYIHSFHTLNDRPRYTQVWDHEFYVMGYFIEMGVAHYRYTHGEDRRLYDATIRLADHLCERFGPEPKRTWNNGHAGLEYALCRLGRLVNSVEGDGAGDKYVALAKHFLDTQHELQSNPYNQSERPAVSMTEATGHAVRATYFYTAMADIALLKEDPDYRTAVDKLWASAIHRKHYLTGGVGASHDGEAFSADFDLQNDGYCESCASCGMGFWADRMNRLHHSSHYHDVFERLIYNNVLGSLDYAGHNFFYQNPLDSSRSRYPWHDCPCCVGNIPRTLLMLKDVMYVTNESRDTLYVNHYLDSRGRVTGVGGGEIALKQSTEYPWRGVVKIELRPEAATTLKIKLRVPDRNESDLYTASPDLTGEFELLVNGEATSSSLEEGYLTLDRTWNPGDVIELRLPMEFQRVYCDMRVEANRGSVAVIRGPIVYNFESVDHEVDPRELALPAGAELNEEWNAELHDGLVALRSTAVVRRSPEKAVPLVGTPNFARLNRGGHSQVWLREAPAAAQPSEGEQTSIEPLSAYLFAYFTGNGPREEQVHFAVSEDGFNYKALNKNRPVLDSKSHSNSGGLRDPHVLRRADGRGFYMVATDLYVPEMGWSNTAMVLMTSDDLIDWRSSVIDIPTAFPERFHDVRRVWAPQTIYDQRSQKYVVYFSMQQPGQPDKLYWAFANKDFTALESAPEQLYYPPPESNTKACIDADIIEKDGQFYLFHKAEDGEPGIKLAVSDSLTEGYKQYREGRMDLERAPVEGSGTFKLIGQDKWVLMYDVYTSGRYQFTLSEDLTRFEKADEQVSMNFHPRHGTVMPITQRELHRLLSKWGDPEDFLPTPTGAEVKTHRVVPGSGQGAVEMLTGPDADLTSLDPLFTAPFGAKVSPVGPQDFSSGPVLYRVEGGPLGDAAFEATANRAANPVLAGYFADPDIIYSHKEGKYYLYPTSDGFPGWSGTSFRAFSSPDLVHWQDEGVILDLKSQVSWANRNAWAPCIIERKVEGQYKYYFYFTAAQQVGVAVSDSPNGPFVDSGKPLINSLPPGVRGGQQIDPDVFADPQSGKRYLYWGNGYMAAAELSDDMLSIKPDTLRVMTPDRTYREGTHVLFRDGRYYFLWSEDDTRSPNYRVRYAMSESPLGPLEIPADNIVIEKSPEAGIYATGHNSTIQVPGADEWYIVYHRFSYPDGINRGDSAGFHREVCIDRMRFSDSGHILSVEPTHKGLASD